jgi:hypothetical protein
MYFSRAIKFPTRLDLCDLSEAGDYFLENSISREKSILFLGFPRYLSLVCFFYRYAFILYDNEQQVARVVEHASQYEINGQPLAISLYCNKKPPNATIRKSLIN